MKTKGYAPAENDDSSLNMRALDLESIWDQNQCFGLLASGGAYCAVGYLYYVAGCHSPVHEDPSLVAVGRYIQKHWRDIPETYKHPINGCIQHPRAIPIDAIIYANNELRLTPEQFREIDRLVQYEAQLAQLAQQVDGIVVERSHAAVLEELTPVGGNAKSSS